MHLCYVRICQWKETIFCSTQVAQKIQSPASGQTVGTTNSTDSITNSVRPPLTPVAPQPSTAVTLANLLVPLCHNVFPERSLWP